MNKTLLQLTQVMEIARAVTTVLVKNDVNMFGYQSKALYFLKYLSVKSNILFNVMDIVSQLKDEGIPITTPFFMTKSILVIYI